LPVRARALAAAILVAATAVMGVAPTSHPSPARAASAKVTIIVGPVGSMTDGYRRMADSTAAAATAAGATVVKVYSPGATWAAVKAAVANANVIVYFGHGNGYPNPYSTTENLDRVNGWGLNRTTTNGDGDNWSTTMVYCGERVLLGALTSADDAARRTYCGGTANDGIAPAPGFVMVYGQAHYAPGFGERYSESDPLPTLAEGQQRVRNYSYPALRLGASAYFATAFADADEIVSRVLTQPTRSYGDIFRQGSGFSAADLKTIAHPDISGAQVWVQKTTNGSNHFGDPDYWYAFAGNPDAQPNGSVAPAAPRVTRLYPSANAVNASTGVVVTATFDQAVRGVSGSTFFLRRASDGAAVAASVSYDSYWKRAALRPSSPLSEGTAYVATVTDGVVSAGTGRAFAGTSWRFTTAGTAPDGSETYSPAAKLTFRQGTHTGYRFGANGAVTAIRTMTLSRDSGASTSRRATLPNQSGRWFYVIDGAWAGYWLRESSAISLATTTVAAPDGTLTIYDPPVRLIFRQGTHTGYRFTSTGAVVAERTSTLAWDSGADASVRRSLTNQFGTWFYVTNGIWAGYFLRESDVISLP
jgi:hypothetical protein